jgi:hypothetical protein
MGGKAKIQSRPGRATMASVHFANAACRGRNSARQVGRINMDLSTRPSATCMDFAYAWKGLTESKRKADGRTVHKRPHRAATGTLFGKVAASASAWRLKEIQGVTTNQTWRLCFKMRRSSSRIRLLSRHLAWSCAPTLWLRISTLGTRKSSAQDRVFEYISQS